MNSAHRFAVVALVAAAVCAAGDARSADAGDASSIVIRRSPRLARRILRDLDRRDVEFGRDGTPTPQGGLSPDGTIGKRHARVIALVVPPPGSADMYEDVAYVDAKKRRYWALRTGGFMAVTQWVGPFRLPRVRR